MKTYILSFSSDKFSLDYLNMLNSEERYALAIQESTWDLADCSTVEAFAELFNAGAVDPEHIYIFAHTTNK